MKTEWRFAFDNPMGAVRSTQRSKRVDKYAKRYEEYKSYVRVTANCAGVPDEIPKGCRAWIDIVIHWKGPARCDLDNAVKGILDAIWKDDRRVDSISAVHYEDSEAVDDFAEVTVRFEDRKEGKASGSLEAAQRHLGK